MVEIVVASLREPLELAWQAGTAPDNLSAVCCLSRPVPYRPVLTPHTVFKSLVCTTWNVMEKWW